MSLMTTQAVAEKLGVTIGRVQQMIWEGKLSAQKMGRDYVVDEAELEKVKDRKRGRPPRPAELTTTKKPRASKTKKTSSGKA